MAALPPRVTRARLLPGLVWILCAATALVSAVAAAACAPGREKAVNSGAPQRIVSLIPATTEMLFAMGAGDRVVGVSSYDHFPSRVETLPRVGGLLDPSVERLLALKPDLVIVYTTQRDLRQQLERASVPMFLYEHQDVADITRTIRTLGSRIGSAPAAESLAADVERRLDAIKARVDSLPRPKTLLVFGREQGALRQVEASGGYGFLHDILQIAGGADALGDIPQQSVQMSTEMILARAPDVIIELHYGDTLAALNVEAERRVWNALPSLPAVRNNRIYLLGGDEFVVPGPRIVDAARRIAETLHPEQ